MIDPDNHRVDALIGTHRASLEATIESHRDLCELRRRWQQVEAMPVLMAHREEGADHSWAGLDIRTLLRGEESAGRFSVHSIVLGPGAAMPAHYQEDAYAYLLMRAGRLTVRVGKVTETLGENGLAFVPLRTRLSFRNAADTPCTVVIVYSPAGAERAFETAHAHWLATGDERAAGYRPILGRYGFRFDDAPLENDDRTNAPVTRMDGEIAKPGDLEELRQAFFARPAVPRIVDTPAQEIDAVTGTGATFRREALTGDESAGQAMINQLAGQPGMKADAHHQPTEEEMFFIGRGGLQMTCATESRLLGEGGFAFCPRNCTHGFVNPNPAAHSRFVTVNAPAGHERALAALRALAGTDASRTNVCEIAQAGGIVFHH